MSYFKDFLNKAGFSYTNESNNKRYIKILERGFNTVSTSTKSNGIELISFNGLDVQLVLKEDQLIGYKTDTGTCYDFPKDMIIIDDLFDNSNRLIKKGKIKTLKELVQNYINPLELNYNKKFKMQKERQYYRIYAIRSFTDVKEGDKGGLIETEQNLSHEGKSWIYDNGKVFGDAQILENGKVYDMAKVYEQAIVTGNGYISNAAQAFGQAVIEGEVYGSAIISGTARVLENGQVHGKVKIASGNIEVDMS